MLKKTVAEDLLMSSWFEGSAKPLVFSPNIFVINSFQISAGKGIPRFESL
jgi:hypothetical protein